MNVLQLKMQPKKNIKIDKNVTSSIFGYPIKSSNITTKTIQISSPKHYDLKNEQGIGSTY